MKNLYEFKFFFKLTRELTNKMIFSSSSYLIEKT